MKPYFLRTASEYLPEDTEKARLRLNQSEFFPATEEKTDSESSCLLFEKEKRLPKRMELRLQEIHLEIFHQPRKGSTQNENYIFIPFLRFFPSPSGRSGQKSYNPHLRWGFDYNPIRGIVLVPLKGVSQTTLLLYSFELLASFLSSSACSIIYFFIVSSEIVPIVAT